MDLYLNSLIEWVENTFTSDAFWPWLFIGIPIWAIGIYLRMNYSNSLSLDVILLRNKYVSLSPPIDKIKEKLLPICEMYVYPVRGIRAAQVDSIELGQHGIKYDREIALAEKTDKAIVTTNLYNPMGCLRQALNGSVVTISTTEPERLTAKNFPLTITIDLEDDPEETGPLVECQKKYSGYQFKDSICDWFSVAIDKEVIAIRSPLRRRNVNNPKRIILTRPDDLRKTFCTDAALHVVNKASVDELRQRVKDRYPEGLPNFFVSPEQFRPNIVIEWYESFAEDRWFELRAGPILIRNAGPCIRCNTIRMNLDKCCRVDENEPYSTLGTFRNIPEMGVIFGMYYQMDVLETENLYRNTLPASQGYPSMETTLKSHPMKKRKGDEQFYVKIKKSDGLLLRCEKEMEWSKKFKKAPSST